MATELIKHLDQALDSLAKARKSIDDVDSIELTATDLADIERTIALAILDLQRRQKD